MEAERPEIFAENGKGENLEVLAAVSEELSEILLNELPPFSDLPLRQLARRF